MSRRKLHISVPESGVTLCARPVRTDRPKSALNDPKAELCRRCARVATRGGGIIWRTFIDGRWMMMPDLTMSVASSSTVIGTVTVSTLGSAS